MARKRDYRAEYQRRIARGKAREYSRAVARGHAPPNVLGIRAAAFLNERPGVEVKGRRKKLRPGQSLRVAVKRDKKGVFGSRTIKRGRYSPFDEKVTNRRRGESKLDYVERTKGFEGETPDEYALRLSGLRKARGTFSWEDERRFVAQMKALGASEREAYSFWFSP